LVAKRPTAKQQVPENWHEGAGKTNVTAVTADGGILNQCCRNGDGDMVSHP
jgi:hypothetical protein